jgi:agmatinase
VARTPFHFLDIPPELREPGRSAAWVLPVPYERTSSYRRGSAGAPAAILEASIQLENWDEELAVDPSLAGIATLPPLDVPEGSPEEGAAFLREALRAPFRRAPLLALLGGEHTLTAPAVAAACEQAGPLTVLQLDAHADLRESWEGTPWNHACAMRRVLDHAPVVGVGIRSISPEEARAVPTLDVEHFPAHHICRRESWQEEVVERLAEAVYVTIDMDVLDLGLAPSVGTPEPGGLTWWPLLRLLRLVCENRRVVGIDLVECNPSGPEDVTAFTAARLLYKTIGYALHAGERPGK